MKIGIDARMINATGIGRYTRSLIENLAKIDKSNHYFLFLKKEEFGSIKTPAENFKKVLADFHWYGISEQIKFPKILKKYNLDLVHFPHFNIPIFYRGDFVTTIHDLTLHKYKTAEATAEGLLGYRLKHFLYKIIIKKAIKKSLKIICPSKFTKRDIIQEFDILDEKIEVTYEGGPSENLKRITPDEKVLEKFGIILPFALYVGNAYPHKNLSLIIEAIKYLPGDVKIVLAGREDHFYKSLKQGVKDKGYENRIIFTGFVTDEELVYLYKKALAYLFPSFNEGFGIPPLEAIGFGLLPVVANSSCLPEVLGDAALYFDPKNANELADSLKMVLKDEKLRNSIIKNGQEKIKIYSWRKMAEETKNIYTRVVNEKHR